LRRKTILGETSKGRTDTNGRTYPPMHVFCLWPSIHHEPKRIHP
jgi:hypothetical protein